MRLAFAALCVFLGLVGCASAPDAIVGLSGVGYTTGLTTHKIFVVTTREPEDHDALFFSGERGDGVKYAQAVVAVPPGHTTGQMKRPRTLPPNPNVHFTIPTASRFANRDQFRAEIVSELRSRPPGDREVLIFVHGFNTSFSSALLQAGQFVHDSNFRGVPVLFSWASRGKTFDYVYDLNSAMMARDALIDTSVLLSQQTPAAERYDVVAHSMGNLLTVEAMRQAMIDGEFNRSGKMGSIILASPDIDIDLFETQLQPFPEEGRKFYVFVSSDDRALATSSLIAGDVQRVGNADSERLSELGVVVIDLTGLSAGDRYNHGKFADAPEAVQMIGSTLLAGGQLENDAPSSLREAAVITILE